MASRRSRITIIDDCPEFLELVEDLLSPDHDTVTFLGHGITPGDIVDSRPDLLIVDLLLNHGDLQGHDILKLTRAHRHLRTVPIVVCTADARARNGYAGAVPWEDNIAVLTKPFTLDALEAVVADGLAQGFAADEDLRMESPATGRLPAAAAAGYSLSPPGG